ncbi:Ger(x)C family spore germination protein [Paenibacillus sp. y28]|uniref:Ger(x)C family spore germination protein n=1 Tax=Paenibacillus sp. y28 TaxID=3129110 RepID=UPI003018D636
MSRRVKQLLLLLLVLLSAAGCWNRREAEKVEYVLAVGIDLNEQGQTVISVLTPVLEALKPQTGIKQEQSKTLSVSGSTTFEAIRNYLDITGKKLFWSHMQVLLIGEKAARADVLPMINFFSSDPELRGTATVAVVKGRALDILESNPDITSNPSDYLNDLLKNADLNAKSPKINYTTFSRLLTDPTGGQAFAPLVSVMDQNQYVRQIVGTAPYQGGDTKQSVLFVTGGMAVFQGGKMAGILNNAETRGFLWAKHMLKSAIVVVPCRDEQCSVSLELSGETGGKIKTRYSDGRVKAEIYVNVEFNIGENTGKQFAVDESIIQYLEEQFNQVVQQEITLAFDKAVRKYHSDVFGFGNRLEDWNPALWKTLKDDWEARLLPEAELEIHVEAKLRRTSRLQYSPRVVK